MNRNDAVVARALSKSFASKGKGKSEPVWAVRDIDLRVCSGAIYGFLGPNGAGKTTTLRMLATLLPIDSGVATVAGFDVARQPQEVRRRIGLVGQRGGADLSATGWENLLLQGQLYGASRDDAQRRATELIDMLDLADFIERKASTYSGGQRRRLEIALGIMHRPQVLFLDEPTLGLDPRTRANLWDHLRELRAAGTTILLTTHYLEEADALADRIAIIDQGRIVAEGTPRELKAQLAGASVQIKPQPGIVAIDALHRDLAAQPYVREALIEGDALRLYITGGTQTLPCIFEFLQARGVVLETLSLSEPSLDDVFLRQTGRSLLDAGKPDYEEVAA